MFLRGINVGSIKIPMADLRTCLENTGLQGVRTVLQTGNVIFRSDQSIDELKPLVENALRQRFNYDANVLIYPAPLIRSVISKYPFPAEKDYHRYVIFCDSAETIEELMSKKKETGTEIALGEHVIYWKVRSGDTLKTPFSLVLAKPRYKALTTNRNLNTLEKMLALGS